MSLMSPSHSEQRTYVQRYEDLLQILEPVQELRTIASSGTHATNGSRAEFMSEVSRKETCESIQVIRIKVFKVFSNDIGVRHCSVDCLLEDEAEDEAEEIPIVQEDTHAITYIVDEHLTFIQREINNMKIKREGGLSYIP